MWCMGVIGNGYTRKWPFQYGTLWHIVTIIVTIKCLRAIFSNKPIWWSFIHDWDYHLCEQHSAAAASTSSPFHLDNTGRHVPLTHRQALPVCLPHPNVPKKRPRLQRSFSAPLECEETGMSPGRICLWRCGDHICGILHKKTAGRCEPLIILNNIDMFFSRGFVVTKKGSWVGPDLRIFASMQWAKLPLSVVPCYPMFFRGRAPIQHCFSFILLLPDLQGDCGPKMFIALRCATKMLMLM